MRPFPWLVAGGSTSRSIPVAGADEPAFTIKAGNELHRILFEDATAARLETRHIARLMGVPDTFVLPKVHRQARRVLGNGLPPPLMEALVPLRGVHYADLFCGAGVGTCTLDNTCELAVEADYDIALAYMLNHTDVVQDFVENVDFRPYKGLDWLHASPVCKNYSVARSGGSGQGDWRDRGEEHTDLSSARATARAVAEIAPRWVTIENVEEYRYSEAFRLVLDALRGYHVDVGVYNAKDYGVPQHRKRLFVRACWDEPAPPPPPMQPHRGWWAAVRDLEMVPTEIARWQWPRLLTGEWVTCDHCEDYFCLTHGLHVADCDCPSIEFWAQAGMDPYGSS